MTEDLFSSTHPLLPPTSEDDRFDRLRLLRSRRVGISTFNRLIAEHGTAREALAALPEVARAAGMEHYSPQSPADTEREMRAAAQMGARMVFIGEADFPAALAQIEDAPPFLWMKGDPELLSKPLLSVVGARNASSLGTRMAKALAKDLGRRGAAIVSGLARGIDTVAHMAALETGTISVFAGGLDVIYPSENTRLAEEIAERGLLLSEQPFGMTPLARHFPARNRIITGLSPAVIVVEAAAKSGSMGAARHALDQGREVMAVPGHPFEPRAAGCNMLLRDGAKLVRSAEDVLEALRPIAPPAARVAEPAVPAPQMPPPPSPGLRDVARLHDQILSRLDPAPMSEDVLTRALGAPVNRISEELTTLEIEGRIERQVGGLVRRLQ